MVSVERLALRSFLRYVPSFELCEHRTVSFRRDADQRSLVPKLD